MTSAPNMSRSRFWAWTAFDAGNSAHALLVSTVGFALYFQQVLFADNPQANTLWALLTALVLTISAVATPFLASWLAFHGRRAQGLLVVTLGCVAATVTLGLPLGKGYAIAVYVISAVGYYVALPIYNSYIEDVADGDADQTSARGWAVGYIGGIVAVALAFIFGLLSRPVTERPDLYRLTFVLAGVFNLVCSLPLVIWAIRQGRSPRPVATSWSTTRIFMVLKQRPRVVRLLLSYWLVGECGTISIYCTAIFLAQYAGMPTATIFALTLAIQLLGAIATWTVGDLARRWGPRNIYAVVCAVWAIVPVLLWAISLGWSYWYALVGMGLVIGSHHAIVRAEVARVSSDADLLPDAKGSIFGFLEVTGRITSVLGPLVIAVLTFFMPLSVALLAACVFPLLGLIVARGYQWQPSAS